MSQSYATHLCGEDVDLNIWEKHLFSCPKSKIDSGHPRVLITGSRTWNDNKLIFKTLDYLWDGYGSYTLVHGGAAGADLIAANYLQGRNRPTEEHLAEWGLYDKRAGFVRNALMASTGVEICLAFIKDESRGATMCAMIAERNGIKVERYLS